MRAGIDLVALAKGSVSFVLKNIYISELVGFVPLVRLKLKIAKNPLMHFFLKVIFFPLSVVGVIDCARRQVRHARIDSRARRRRRRRAYRRRVAALWSSSEVGLRRSRRQRRNSCHSHSWILLVRVC